MTSTSRTSSAIEPYLYPIAVLTVLALLVELVALRVLTRTAIHIPGLDRLGIGYRVVSEIGRLAFGAAVVLVFALMIVAAIDGGVRGRRGLAMTITTFLVVAALAAIGVVGTTGLSVVTILAVLAVPLVCLPLNSKPPSWDWASPVLFVVAFLIAGLPTVVGELAPDLRLPVTTMWQVAEAIAIVAGIALVSRTAGSLVRRSVLVGGLAGGIVLVSLVGQPSTTETLMLWNLGLAGYFHPLIYAAGAAIMAYAMHGAWSLGDRSVAIGAALVVAGGLGLHSAYQSAAFLMGVVILSQPAVVRRSQAFANNVGVAGLDAAGKRADL